MRLEQKLLLAAGVVACGLASSLFFRHEAPPLPLSGKGRPATSHDLNLMLRRDASAHSTESAESFGHRSAAPANASISAIPDEGRLPQTRPRLPEVPSEVRQSFNSPDGTSVPLETQQRSPDATSRPPRGRIRDLIPFSTQ